MTLLHIVLLLGSVSLLAVGVLAVLAWKRRRDLRDTTGRVRPTPGPRPVTVAERLVGAQSAAGGRPPEHVIADPARHGAQTAPFPPYATRHVTPTLALSDPRFYRDRWREIQSRFVDSPEGAVREAHELMIAVMADLGGADDDAAQRFRATTDAVRSARGEAASTEELRLALLHFRGLFDDLIEAAPSTARMAGSPWDERRPPVHH
jgi:hypothetical protein